MVQVASPDVSSVVVEVVHVEPLHATVPPGVPPPSPVTVAVKIKVPPPVIKAELSVTLVVELLRAPAGAAGRAIDSSTSARAAMAQISPLFLVIDSSWSPSRYTGFRPADSERSAARERTIRDQIRHARPHTRAVPCLRTASGDRS